MIKLAFTICLLVALVTGAIAKSYIVGIAVFNGLFVLGLLMIIAYAVQELIPRTQELGPKTFSDSPEPDEDEDLTEDVEFVWNEEIGELVEAPAPKRRRR